MQDFEHRSSFVRSSAGNQFKALWCCSIIWISWHWRWDGTYDCLDVGRWTSAAPLEAQSWLIIASLLAIPLLPLSPHCKWNATCNLLPLPLPTPHHCNCKLHSRQCCLLPLPHPPLHYPLQVNLFFVLLWFYTTVSGVTSIWRTTANRKEDINRTTTQLHPKKERKACNFRADHPSSVLTFL